MADIWFVDVIPDFTRDGLITHTQIPIATVKDSLVMSMSAQAD